MNCVNPVSYNTNVPYDDLLRESLCEPCRKATRNRQFQPNCLYPVHPLDQAAYILGHDLIKYKDIS